MKPERYTMLVAEIKHYINFHKTHPQGRPEYLADEHIIDMFEKRLKKYVLMALEELKNETTMPHM